MKTNTSLMGILVVGLLIVGAGCQGVPAPGNLEELPDANSNGFGDVTPPEGVAFDTATNVNIRVTNVVTRDQAIVIAADLAGVDPGLLNAVQYTVELEIVLDYGNGVTETLDQTASLGPFEFSFEVACPDSITVNTLLVGVAPIVGRQEFPVSPVSADEGVDYNCGDTIIVESVVDANGNPQVTIDFQ